MKKFLLFILFLLICTPCSFAADSKDNTTNNLKVEIYSNKNKFGLKLSNGEIITPTKYNKIIPLNGDAWIIQKKTRFGLIGKDGKYIVQPKYRHAERILGQYAKLGNEKDFGLYDKNGKTILPPEYSRIELLFGKKFLTCKNYKYGVVNEYGKTLIPNQFEDLYMPNPKVLRVKIRGEWFEITQISKEEIVLPNETKTITINDKEFKVTTLMANTGFYSGYSVVNATNYLLKIFSSISPAYEETIDELMYSQGADAIGILMNSRWLISFPGTYARKYYNNITAPNNGPLADIKEEIKNQIK